MSLNSGWWLIYANEWYLAEVAEKFPEKEEIKLKALNPAGNHNTTRSFYYPQREDVWIATINEILTVPDPLTATGRIWTLTETKFQDANNMFKLK